MGEGLILVGLGEEYMVSFGDADFLGYMERCCSYQGGKEGRRLSSEAFALPRRNFCHGCAALFFLFLCQLLETRQRCELGKQIDAQLFEKLLHLSAVDRLLHFFQRAFHRHVSLDGGQPIRQVSHVFIGRQLFPEGSFDFIYMRIDFIQRAVLRNQFQCRLLSHAGDAGDIVRRIAHESFHINHLGWRDVVFLFHRCRRHGRHLGDALLREVHRGALACRLQHISIAGDDVNRHLLLVAKRKSPQDVIAFIAVQTIDRCPQDAHHIANEIKLGHQLRRRRLSRGLVAVKHVRAECVAVFIKSDGHVLRVKVPVQPQKHAKKSKHRIGRNPLRRCHGRRQCIKRAVQQTAAINDHQFLFHNVSSTSHSVPCQFRIYYIIVGGIRGIGAAYTISLVVGGR